MQKFFLNKKRNQYLTQNFPENPLPTKKLSKKSRSLILNTRRNFQNKMRNHLKNLRKVVIKDVRIKEKTDFSSISSLSSPQREKNLNLSLIKENWKSVLISKTENGINYAKTIYNWKSLILFKTFINFKYLYKKQKTESVKNPLRERKLFPFSSLLTKVLIDQNRTLPTATGGRVNQNVRNGGLQNIVLKTEVLRNQNVRDGVQSKKTILGVRKKDEKPKSLTFRSKFQYSLEQLLAEFYKRNSQQRKVSFFKELLIERKKLSLIYGNLSIREIKKSVEKAKEQVGNFQENLIKILESRLDVVLYRICFFPTIFAARQSINHGQILVNNKKVIFSGYQLKPGEVIKIDKDSKKMLKKCILKFYKKEIEGRSLPFLLDNDLIKTLFSKTCHLSFPYLQIEDLLNKGERKIVTNKSEILKVEKKENQYKSFFPPFLKYLKKMFKNSNKSSIKFANSKSKIGTRNKLSQYQDFNNPYLCSAYGNWGKSADILINQNVRDGGESKGTRKKERNNSLISFLKVKKKWTSKVSPFLRLAPFRVSSQKPLHLEISYKGLFAIFLYSPQRVLFPAHIDFAKVKKSVR